MALSVPLSKLTTKLFIPVILLSVIAGILPDNLLQADDTAETQETLNQAIRDHLTPLLSSLNASQTRLDIGLIDPRLRLRKCSTPLQLEQLGNKGLSGKVNIRIRCQSESWGIFIPVDIQVYGPVVVSRVTLPRGSIIRQEVLALREMETSALNYSYFQSIEQVAGTEATKAIQANGVIFSNMVQAADAVRKGDDVIISARTGNLNVRIKGQALQDGAIGEQIQVRNSQSKRIIKAIITGPGSVLVPM